MRDGSGTPLINYASGSAALGTALTSNNIWFHGSNAMAANSGQRVKMYAPTTWSGGSSYSHLDYATFNNTSNQLMVYAFTDGESVHDPGAITRGLFKDLGWKTGGSVIPTAAFPWAMYLPAINAGGGSPPPPVQNIAYWGVDNDVCCTTSSSTFSFTLGGVTKTSALASCTSASTWTGWASTTPGPKSFAWQWTAAGCGSWWGTFPWTLEKGKYHMFELSWNGSDFIMNIYTSTAPFPPQAAVESSGSPAGEGQAGSWQRVEEIVLDIAGDAAPPKGILKATH